MRKLDTCSFENDHTKNEVVGHLDAYCYFQCNCIASTGHTGEGSLKIPNFSDGPLMATW